MEPFRDLSDVDLLAATGREPAAFGAFYRRYEAPVLRYLMVRARDADLAADLAAEVFARALEASERFDDARAPDGSAAGWLFTIAHNTLMTSLRRRRVADGARRRLGIREPLLLEDDALERIVELASVEGDPVELLDALPAAQREAIVAHVVDGLGYGEIAERTRCSALVIRKRVSRGLTTLRTQLEEQT